MRFQGSYCLGGFENGKRDFSIEAVRKKFKLKPKRLIEETGKDGLILGADCTIPSDIAVERIQWVREAVAK